MSSAVRERMIIKLIITVIFLMGNIIYPQDKNGKSLIDDLVDASFTGDIVKVKDLLEKKVNINSKDQFGRTALHAVSAGGHLEITKLLLKRGAKVNVQIGRGWTIFGKAIIKGDLKEAEYLLNHKWRDLIAEGETPLHIASRAGHLEIVKLLIENGASLNIKEANGDTPLHNAINGKHLEIVQLLIEKGSNVNEKGAFALTPIHTAFDSSQEEIIKLLLNKGSDVNTKDNREQTVLHKAVSLGNLEITKLIVAKGIDANLKNEFGHTALHIAIQFGNIDLIKYLIKNNANVNIQDIEGMTPLHSTTANGAYPEIIQILLSQGADRTLMNNNGKTALDIAKEMGNKKMITILSK